MGNFKRRSTHFFGKGLKRFLLKLWVCHFFLFAMLMEANAKVVIDVYKTNQITAKEVTQKFGKKIQEIAGLMSPKKTVPSSEFERSGKLWMEVISGIQSMGDFAHVNMSLVFYTGQERDHVTIDIVDKKDQHRLGYFLPKPNESFPDPDHLIAKWVQYEKQGVKIAFQSPRISSTTPVKCPAHHCVYGFEHKDLKPYEATFNQLVPKNRKKLVAILKKDKDENKRASACFLLAHLKNPKDVIRIISPSVFDSNAGVRNAAMRVVGEILTRNPKIDFPVKTALIALDFPSETDRNKALFIISALLNKPSYRDYLKKQASMALVDQLQMKQPNLHELSYRILKKISGKNLGEHDYKAWKQWAASVQQSSKNAS